MKEPRALIFDCDGTLVDSMALHWRAWDTVCKRHGIEFSEKRHYAMGGIPSRKILAILKEEQGLDFDPLQEGGGGYKEGGKWFLYAGAVLSPEWGDSWPFSIADPDPLHVVTAYEEGSSDVHALHDFFETVISPDGSWIGIAYQQNVGQHPFEENEEQRYIKFVRGNISSS